jgi:hypothetical protein
LENSSIPGDIKSIDLISPFITQSQAPVFSYRKSFPCPKFFKFAITPHLRSFVVKVRAGSVGKKTFLMSGIFPTLEKFIERNIKRLARLALWQE